MTERVTQSTIDRAIRAAKKAGMDVAYWTVDEAAGTVTVVTTQGAPAPEPDLMDGVDFAK